MLNKDHRIHAIWLTCPTNKLRLLKRQNVHIKRGLMHFSLFRISLRQIFKTAKED